MFKPMLAPGEDPLSYPDYFDKLQYPLLGSPKFDGIRCIIKSNKAMSRSFKMLPSAQVQEEFVLQNHLDGEIIAGNATDFDVYNRTQSYVMSENKPGDLSYYVFDYCHPDWLDKPFYERLSYAKGILPNTPDNKYYMIEHYDIENYQDLVEYENKCLEAGFEGIMLRDPVGRYKMGRGTFREGLIYKLKRFKDAEGKVIGFQEQMDNYNIKEKDELGYSKRSSSKEGLVPANTLGRFIIDFNGMELDIAPGNFNHLERKEIWSNQDEFLGKLLKFRYFNHGIKDKPRFPRAIGFRNLMDL